LLPLLATNGLAWGSRAKRSWVTGPWGQARESLEVVASREGFQPDEIRLHKGETFRLVLSTADEEHCFAVDELRIEKRIVPGKKTVFDLTPAEAGTFVFYCCLDRDLKGSLVVTE
jgi:heme/copper-type cytochrome/quinol oxidase subunit 2